MAFEFKLPDPGEGIHEGVLVKWHKQVGDSVNEDETVCELETDKAVVEIPSPKDGTIAELRFKEGDTINVGDVFLVITEEGEEVTQVSMAKPSEEVKNEVATKEEPVPEKKEYTGVIGDVSGVESMDLDAPIVEKKEEVSDSKVKALPKVRKLAEEKGIDLNKVKGTGPDGAITMKDIEGESSEAKAVEKPEGSKEEGGSQVKSKRKYDMFGYVDRIEFKGVRKVIADNMLNSVQKTAQLTHMDEADVTHLYEIRKSHKEMAEKQGVHLTFLPFVLKAMMKSIEKYPIINSELDREGAEIIVKKYINIGIAVDTEYGLVVPVIKRAENKSVMDLAKEIQELAEKAKEKKLNPMDMKGGSITVTNVGSIGGKFVTPILNYPQSTNLGIMRITEEPRYIEGELKPRKIMPIVLTYDHQVYDGATAARFMNELKLHLEDPDLMILED